MQRQPISNSNTLVSQAEYARSRGLNKSTISRQVQRGVILLHGGLVDPREADERRRTCLSLTRGRRKNPASGGADASDGRGASTAPVVDRFAGVDTAGPVYLARRELLDTILGNSCIIPELALKLGCRDMGLAVALYEMFRSLVIDLTDGIEAEVYDWAGNDDIPDPDQDYKALAKKYRLSYGPKSEARADTLCEALEKLTGESELERMLQSRKARQ